MSSVQDRNKKWGKDIMDEQTARNHYLENNGLGKGIFHPDTDNTFACWEFQNGKWSIWVNARNGDVVAMGRRINTY